MVVIIITTTRMMIKTITITRTARILVVKERTSALIANQKWE
jgi:hypothetical protein